MARIEDAGNSAPVTTEEPAETAEPTQTPAPAATEAPAVTEKPAQTGTPAATEKPAQPETPAQTKKPAETETPAQTEKSEEISQPSQPETSAQPPQPEASQQPVQPEQPKEPVHEHSWKEHYAETQTWIPNIVVVEDYGEIPGEKYSVCICNCGFETSDGDGMRSHIMAHEEAGESSQFSGYDTYGESTWGVIGSHEEDQGHYETSRYVDYYYCDCGARK